MAKNRQSRNSALSAKKWAALSALPLAAAGRPAAASASALAAAAGRRR
jgi:hypothetical protein